MPTITYSLESVVAALNSKIEQLQNDKKMVEEQISRGFRVTENQQVLDQINQSLSKANTGKVSLEDSCCTTQSCFYEYYS